MKVFYQSRYTKDDVYKKSIELKNIGAKLVVNINKNMTDSKVPIKLEKWIKKQQKYIKNTKNKIGKEMLIFITRFSMKTINYYIDQNEYDQNKFYINQLNDLSVDKDTLKKSLIQLMYSIYPIDKETIVYSGLDYNDYKYNFNKNDYIYNKRIRSTTLDKYHALNYAHYRSKDNGYYMLEIKLPPDTFCIYDKFENQILLPPYSRFKVIAKEKIKSKYKDILSSEFSKEEIEVECLKLEVVSDYDRLYKYYKDRLTIAQEILDKQDGVICEKRIRYTALLLFRRNKGNYDLLMLIRSGDKKLMTPGGNVSIPDVYKDDGSLYENACYNGLLREVQEEFGTSLPHIKIKNTFVFKKHTKIYICETNDHNVKFISNDEAVGLRWISLRNIRNERIVGYVRDSLNEMLEKGLLNKYK